jgi:hypothetical protein
MIVTWAHRASGKARCDLPSSVLQLRLPESAAARPREWTRRAACRAIAAS